MQHVFGFYWGILTRDAVGEPHARQVLKDGCGGFVKRYSFGGTLVTPSIIMHSSLVSISVQLLTPNPGGTSQRLPMVIQSPCKQLHSDAKYRVSHSCNFRVGAYWAEQCVRACVCVCEPELPFGFAQLLNIFQWLVNGVHGVCNAFGFDSTEPVTHNSAALEKTKYLW